MRIRNLLLTVALTSLLAAGPASAAEIPNHQFLPQRTMSGAYENICGVAVSLSGDVYLSDYYHHRVVFPGGQIANVGGGNGPCGLAVDSAKNVYVNLWHGDVVRYTPPYTSPEVIYDGRATGIAIDPLTDDLYVNERTSVARYASPVEAGDVSDRFGEGTLGDGYGVAVSNFPTTENQVFAGDASSGTVKVYDPATPADPVAEIDGAGTPQGAFVSLIEAALAIDQSNGHLFVADNTQPGFEHPVAVVDEFNDEGLYRGQLPHPLVHPEPVGIAINESSSARRGEVYVSSGNGSSIVYPPKQEIPSSELSVVYGFGPAGAGDVLSVAVIGSGSGTVSSSPAGIACGSACAAEFNRGATVTLQADPAPGSAFSGWSGACSGTGSCQVTMATATSVTAEFAPAPALLGARSTVTSGSTASAAGEEPASEFALGHPSSLGQAAVLPVRAPEAGTLALAGPRVRPLRASVDGPGEVALRVKLNRAGRRALSRSGSGRIATRVRVRFAPSRVGPTLVRSISVVFGKNRKGEMSR